MTFDDFAAEFRDVALPAAVQERHRALLRSAAADDPAPSPSRRRLPRLLPALTAAVLLVGGGTATATYFLTAPPERVDTAFCFGSLSLDESPTNRIEFAVVGEADSLGDAAAAGFDICGSYWEDGIFPAATTPELVACVLPTGHAGIFPGDSGACSALGLANLSLPK